MAGTRRQPRPRARTLRERAPDAGRNAEVSREAAWATEEWESEGGALLDESDAETAPAEAQTPAPGRRDHRKADTWDAQPMTGIIAELRPGGFGYIASDARGKPWRLKFRRSAAATDGFDDLRVGQRVRFVQVPVPGNTHLRHAVKVVPLD